VPHFPEEPPVTAATFKRWIRDLQVWCSSCMVAFSGPDPIGVLIGAKRAGSTLVFRIAVHPDHLRQGHGRHLLESLGSKLAILGPPRIVAEVPDQHAPASALFAAAGYVEEARLTDYISEAAAGSAAVRAAGESHSTGADECFVIPITLEDLSANGLLDQTLPTCWERSVDTLTARRDDIQGLAVVAGERIEAFVLHDGTGEILSLRSLAAASRDHLTRLVSRLPAAGQRTLRFSKVHPLELETERLQALGLRPAGVHRVYAARPRPA